VSSHPALLPDLFLDRSLGAVQVPRILRAAGLKLVTLTEHYGKPADQEITDVRCINDATAHDWVCLLKDSAVARNVAERQAIRDAGARCFCIVNQNLPAAQMAGRLLAAIGEITEVCDTKPGPFMYRVERGKISEIDLNT